MIEEAESGNYELHNMKSFRKFRGKAHRAREARTFEVSEQFKLAARPVLEKLVEMASETDGSFEVRDRFWVSALARGRSCTYSIDVFRPGHGPICSLVFNPNGKIDLQYGEWSECGSGYSKSLYTDKDVLCVRERTMRHLLRPEISPEKLDADKILGVLTNKMKSVGLCL
ncbi:MAG: hypothetical protein PHE27_07350 [Alphaproteobacteria bacterium]|nr:hypothetical protein [Alphaproteobacteria bacterium]